jgi:peptide deformylase
MIQTPNIDKIKKECKSPRDFRKHKLALIRIGLITVLWLLCYKIYHYNDVHEIPVERSCSDLDLITPDEYVPKKCKLVTQKEEANVLEIAAKLIELAYIHKHDTLTSYSIGFDYCMFISKEVNRKEYQVFLNPRMHTKSNVVLVKEKSILCKFATPKSMAQNISFFADIGNLTQQRVLVNAMYTSAMSINHALDVLTGKMQC